MSGYDLVTSRTIALRPHRVLDTLDTDSICPTMGLDETVEALQLMLAARAFDERAFRMQRQGRFGTFSQVLGQEAALVGAAFALDPGRDWAVPQYRELPVLLRQGLPLEQFIRYFTGSPLGGHVPDGVNCLPLNIALGSQVPHAVGLGWGLRLNGDDGVVCVFFGDGASSEGDVHEAMNLAGVVKAPVVFFLSNNGWAISTPRSRQSAAESLAGRAAGYGIPGVAVDGNDLFAVHAVTKEAVERARSGAGPTVIEALTYRVGPHNTADDPTRYIDDAERESWLTRDPIEAIRKYLRDRGRWDEAAENEAAARHQQWLDEAFARAADIPQPHSDQLFDHLYDELPARAKRQRSSLRTTPDGTGAAK